MAADEKLVLKNDNETVHNAKVECLVVYSGVSHPPAGSLGGGKKRAWYNDCMRVHEPLPTKRGKPGFMTERPFEGIIINV